MPHPAARLLPILDVAAALGVEVSGRQARCFNREGHRRGDRNPSLVFFPDYGRFKCFACGLRGDAIDLVRAVRSCSFSEAVSWIEQLAGRSAGGRRGVASQTAPPNNASPLSEERMQQLYYNLYYSCCPLEPGLPATEYLIGRGIDPQLAENHRVVANRPSREIWQELLAKFGLEALRAAGLVSRSGQYLFGRHELLFFYTDDDVPVFIQARDITGQAEVKELSLSGLPCPLPYNSDLLRDPPETICLCEGPLDTLSALQLGCPAVGVPGVAGFREEWFELFRGVGRVQILFDNDDAGQRAAARLRQRFRRFRIEAEVLRPVRWTW